MNLFKLNILKNCRTRDTESFAVGADLIERFMDRGSISTIECMLFYVSGKSDLKRQITNRDVTHCTVNYGSGTPLLFSCRAQPPRLRSARTEDHRAAASSTRKRPLTATHRHVSRTPTLPMPHAGLLHLQSLQHTARAFRSPLCVCIERTEKRLTGAVKRRVHYSSDSCLPAFMPKTSDTITSILINSTTPYQHLFCLLRKWRVTRLFLRKYTEHVSHAAETTKLPPKTSHLRLSQFPYPQPLTSRGATML